jgi:hypothetical protein
MVRAEVVGGMGVGGEVNELIRVWKCEEKSKDESSEKRE